MKTTQIIKTKTKMKDVRINIKLSLSIIVLLVPFVPVYLLDDPLQLKWLSLSLFIISGLFIPEKKYLGFLKTWFRFHFLHHYKDGFSRHVYKHFKNRLRALESKQYAYYEQRLIKEILTVGGAVHNKMKLTGKGKNKVRIKHRRTFENDSSRNVKVSNYSS